MAAKPEQIEFTHEDWSAVVKRAMDLSDARRGWINLYPEVEDDEGFAREGAPVIGLAAMFRTFGPTVPSATWVFATSREPATIGIQHNLRSKVLPRLRENNIYAPEGTVRMQDNGRRGLVLRLPAATTVEVVLAYLMASVDDLCPLQLTGGWLAEVHSG